MAYKVTNWENIETRSKAASQVFTAKEFVGNDGTGGIIPSAPATVVEGIVLENVLASDVDFATTRRIAIEVPSKNVDLYRAEVTNGPAVAAMEGSTFDVDAADASKIDVGGAGTQFMITAIISETEVEFKFV